MDETQPYHLRMTIIAGIGLITALATMTGVILFLGSVTPKNTDKAYPIQAELTLSLLQQTGALRLPEGEYVIHDPLAMFGSLQQYFRETDPALAEGIDGILEQKLLQATGKTDLLKAIHNLATKELTVTILSQGNRTLFALTGQGASKALVEEWFEAVKTSRASGIVRILPLPDGNTRKDVVVAPPQELEEHGWRILQDSASEQLMIAIKGNRFAASNDKALLMPSLTKHVSKNPMQLSLLEKNGSLTLRLRAMR